MGSVDSGLEEEKGVGAKRDLAMKGASYMFRRLQPYSGNCRNTGVLAFEVL